MKVAGIDSGNPPCVHFVDFVFANTHLHAPANKVEHATMMAETFVTLRKISTASPFARDHDALYGVDVG